MGTPAVEPAWVADVHLLGNAPANLVGQPKVCPECRQTAPKRRILVPKMAILESKMGSESFVYLALLAQAATGLPQPPCMKVGTLPGYARGRPARRRRTFWWSEVH